MQKSEIRERPGVFRLVLQNGAEHGLSLVETAKILQCLTQRLASIGGPRITGERPLEIADSACQIVAAPGNAAKSAKRHNILGREFQDCAIERLSFREASQVEMRLRGIVFRGYGSGGGDDGGLKMAQGCLKVPGLPLDAAKINLPDGLIRILPDRPFGLSASFRIRIGGRRHSSHSLADRSATILAWYSHSATAYKFDSISSAALPINLGNISSNSCSPRVSGCFDILKRISTSTMGLTAGTAV